MKLKFERFEGLASFSVRGTITAPEVKLLTVGLETLAKDLQETLLVNLSIAEVPEALHPVLLQVKKHVLTLTKQKVFWVTPIKSVGDFATIALFASRLAGSKSRQIGERIKIEDDIYHYQEQIRVLENKVNELGGDDARAKQIILENRILKEQERILEQTIAWQSTRNKNQIKVPTLDDESDAKIKASLDEIKKFYSQEIGL